MMPVSRDLKMAEFLSFDAFDALSLIDRYARTRAIRSISKDLSNVSKPISAAGDGVEPGGRMTGYSPPNLAACVWCDRPFKMRQSGGHAQRFCSPRCRLAFHAAARCWALDAIEAGVLRVDDIKQGIQPTYTSRRRQRARGQSPPACPRMLIQR